MTKREKLLTATAIIMAILLIVLTVLLIVTNTQQQNNQTVQENSEQSEQSDNNDEETIEKEVAVEEEETQTPDPEPTIPFAKYNVNCSEFLIKAYDGGAFMGYRNSDLRPTAATQTVLNILKNYQNVSGILECNTTAPSNIVDSPNVYVYTYCEEDTCANPDGYGVAYYKGGLRYMYYNTPNFMPYAVCDEVTEFNSEMTLIAKCEGSNGGYVAWETVQFNLKNFTASTVEFTSGSSI